MVRTLVIALVLTLVPAAAFAQLPGQYNPATPTVPSLPPPPIPPQAMPGMAPPPPVLGTSSASRPRKAAKIPRLSPGTTSHETINDRAIRCAHQGAAGGVPSGAMGTYMAGCVNQ